MPTLSGGVLGQPGRRQRAGPGDSGPGAQFLVPTQWLGRLSVKKTGRALTLREKGEHVSEESHVKDAVVLCGRFDGF